MMKKTKFLAMVIGVGATGLGALAGAAAPARADGVIGFSYYGGSYYGGGGCCWHRPYPYWSGPVYMAPPPVVYAPPPPVVVYPAPPQVVAPPVVAYAPPPPPPPVDAVPTSPAYTDRQGRTCREFQSQVTIGGRRQPSYGTACLQPDGSWKIVP